MRDVLDAIALGLGYLSLVSIAVLALISLAVVSVNRQTPRRRITVARYGPFLTPHQLRHPVYHVDAPDEATAWKAIDQGGA